MQRARIRAASIAVALVAAVVALAVPTAPTAVGATGPRPVGAPGRTSTITLVSSATADGWRFDFYRNTAYPCSVSGYQTFTIATRVGSDPDAVAPLWVFLHGGGIGYFATDGSPRPGAGQKVEESPALQQRNALAGELKRRIAEHPSGFRMMAVSMCNHDIYAGGDVADPNNPLTTPDGAPRTVNGLFATTAAVQQALMAHPTDDYVLYGGSAGSYGTYHVAWNLEEIGIPPAGIVADSGVMNIAWQQATFLLPGCGRGPEAAVEIPKRLHPEVVDPANGPDRLVATGRLTVPIVDVFSVGDAGQCGELPLECPVGGQTITLGSVECMHEPLRRAIEAQGEESRSLSMDLCVRRGPGDAPCQSHVPSNGTAPNTRAPWPADFRTVIVDWVTARLADDGSAVQPPTTGREAFVHAALTDLLGTLEAPQVEAGVHALGAGQSTATFLRRLTTSDPWLEAIVADLYDATLGRPGDPAGVAYWVDRLRTGSLSVAQVAAGFFASPEYFQGLGGDTDATWVSDLYAEVLGRSPEPGGVAYWTGEVARTGRSAVALRFYQSPESARARVVGLYTTLLGRPPSSGDVAFWAPRVVAQGDLALAVSLAASPEYGARAESRFLP